MGVLDKLTGKDHHKAPVTRTTQTAGGNYAAHDPNAPNTTGAVYGQQQQQQSYPTHGDATHGTHHEKNHGLLSKNHNEPTTHHGTTTGVAHGAPTGGIGSTATSSTQHNTQGYPAGASTGAPGAYNDGTTGYAADPHHNTNTSGTSGSGGLFKKKDDLEDSLEKERRAKAELDAAMAKHQAAQQDASGKLQAQEDKARAEFEAAERRLKEAQATRQQHGL